MTFGRYSSELAMYCPFACRPGWALSNAVSRASICAGAHSDVQYVKVVEFGDDFDGDEPHAAASSATREPATTALARGGSGHEDHCDPEPGMMSSFPTEIDNNRLI
jgi:hypothetical protein